MRRKRVSESKHKATFLFSCANGVVGVKMGNGLQMFRAETLMSSWLCRRQGLASGLSWERKLKLRPQLWPVPIQIAYQLDKI